MAPEDRAGAAVLMDMHRPLFESSLLNACGDEQRWAHRIKTFESCGLLDFHTASTLKPKPVLDQFVETEDGERLYVFSEEQLDQPRWKRGLIRKLKAPRPSKWTRHRLPIHRDKIMNDPKYREDISKVLAYKWVGHIDEPDSMDMMYMQLMDAAALDHFLDTFRLNDISAEKMNAYLVRRLAEELLDKNEKFQELMARMKSEIAPIREQFAIDIRRICEDAMAQSQPVFDAILAEANARADAAIAEIRARSAASEARYAEVIAEHGIKADEDRQESFRRAVDQKIARRNAARKRLARMRRRRPGGFVLWLGSWLAIVGVPVFLAFHLKVGSSETTLVELISQLFN